MENINKEKVLKDYYKCIGTFKNCSIIYNELNILSTISNNNIDQKVLEGQKDDLLSNLGKVGEKAFKYIYGLEILRLYPSIDSVNFESHFCKNGPLKEFIKKHDIKLDDEHLEEIFNYIDVNNQKSHNFDYWYKVLKMTMPELIAKYEQLVIYNKQSKLLLDYCKQNDEYIYKDQLVPYFTDAIFPQMYEIRMNNNLFLTKEQTEKIIFAQRKAIKESGDIFTRLRYASNNPDQKEFDLNEIYALINNLVTFIEMIHGNNDDLNIDLDLCYGLKIALECKEELEMSEEDIKKFFSLNISSNMLALLFFERVKLKEIEALLALGVPQRDLLKINLKGLNSRSIKFFHSIGIYDYNEMQRRLEKYMIDGQPIKK